MKEIIGKLDKAFENRHRLGIMSLLMVNESVDFNTLKETLALQDGTLASHLRGLENKKFISVNKGFVGRKTRTTYQATEEGRKAFEDHLNALEQLLKGIE